MARRPSSQPSPVTLWQMLRDVLIHAMNKGQLGTTLLGLSLLVIVIRLPDSSLAELGRRILVGFENWHLTGYVGTLIMGTGWVCHVRWLLAQPQREMKRITEERNFWQEKATGHPVQSSETHEGKEGEP